MANLESNKHQTIWYHNRNATEEEKEEFAIAGAFEESKNLKELGSLLRDGKMKEFYQIANKVLRIKRNHPVVTAVKRENENGESEVFEERGLVEQAIAEYFSGIYRRPEHMAVQLADSDQREDVNMIEESINTTALFSVEDIKEAMKQSNFNKGLGPDCFDGNLIAQNEQLGVKVMTEIADALNNSQIPDYLRVGRLVPLQKTYTKGPSSLDDIRPIVVRSHLSKIMEKAILERIKSESPHLIQSQVYQTGFKEGKSTAIHASRLLNEVHGPKKRKFNLLIVL